MTARIYGFLGALVAMVGVAVGLLVKVTQRIARIEKLLEKKSNRFRRSPIKKEPSGSLRDGSLKLLLN